MNKCSHDSEPWSPDSFVLGAVDFMQRYVTAGGLCRYRIHHLGVETRSLPSVNNHLDLIDDIWAGSGEIRVDEVSYKLSKVCLFRNREAAVIEEGLHILYWATVRCVAVREKQKLVEHGKNRRRRLMNTCDDDQLHAG